VQVPWAHSLTPLQKAPSSQLVPSGTNAFAGHDVTRPLHISGTSQMPLAARQMPVRLRSGGHAAEAPVHCSARSQSPCGLRQTIPAPKIVSAGQEAPPLHSSLGSHSPALGRQVVPIGFVALPGHGAETPSQTSAMSQSPAAARQTTPDATSACWQTPAPSHCSVVQPKPSSGHGDPPGAAWHWLSQQSLAA
jgi:hypothetical protein